MRKKAIIFPGFVALFVFLSTVAAVARVVYSKLKPAVVYESAEPGARRLALAPYGQALTVLREEPYRYFVRTPSKQEGYVFRLHVSDTRPADVALSATDSDTTFTLSIDGPTSPTIALDPTGKPIPAPKGNPAPRPTRLEDSVIDHFMREGKLGPYWDGEYR